MSWPPKFAWTETVAEAADAINRPHEDYPARVGRTADAIRRLTQDFAENELVIREPKILAVHASIMSEYDWRGTYRDCLVRVGVSVPPGPEHARKLMALLHPFAVATKPEHGLQDMEFWYRRFEEIRDGNGRVGGAFLSAVSYVLTGRYRVSGV